MKTKELKKTRSLYIKDKNFEFLQVLKQRTGYSISEIIDILIEEKFEAEKKVPYSE